MKIALPTNFNRQVHSTLLRKSFKDFTPEAWDIISPDAFRPGWHIDAVGDHLQAVSNREIKRLLICMPPRHGKSKLTSVLWSAWEWLEHPETRFLSTSYSMSLSVRDSVECRMLIDSPFYQDLCDFKLKKDQNTKLRFDNNKHGFRLSTSIGGHTTGEGGDILLIDDPFNVTEAYSPTIRAKVIFWWDKVMSTRANNMKDVRIVIICQRVHEMDLIGHILATQGEYWEKLILPAEYVPSKKCTTSIGWKDPRTKENELLWKESYDRKEFELLKRSLGSAAPAQLQQDPIPDKGIIIDRDWLQFYNSKTLPHVLRYTWSLDSAIKDKEINDYSVFGLWALCKDGHYLVDLYRAKLVFPQLLVQAKLCYSKQPCAILVEDKASGQQLLQMFKNSILPTKGITPIGSKEERLRLTSHHFEAGKVKLPEDKYWIQDYVTELVRFPNGDHDDQVDMTTQYLTYMDKEFKQLIARVVQ